MYTPEKTATHWLLADQSGSDACPVHDLGGVGSTRCADNSLHARQTIPHIPLGSDDAT